MDEDLSGDIDLEEPLDTGTATKTRFMSLLLSSIQWRDWLQKRREAVQPWGEFLSAARFKLPKALAPAGRRVIKNIDRFQSNYLFVFLGLVLFCIITSPLLLVAIAACLGACYIISLRNQDSTLALLGKEVSIAQQYACVGVVSFPLFWIAGAGSAVFWIIGASVFVIILHASTYSLAEEKEPFADLEIETV